MAASRFSSNVLETFYSPLTREQNRNLPQPLRPELDPLYDVFKIRQSNFQEWLCVWIMNASKTNPNNKDILVFARENKEKFTDLIEQEILKLGSVKVSFGLQVEFEIERKGIDYEQPLFFHSPSSVKPKKKERAKIGDEGSGSEARKNEGLPA